MIARGYTLDLYCDAFTGTDSEIHVHRKYRGGEAQYTGETLRECLRNAKRDGWRIVVSRGEVVCPKCWKAGGRATSGPAGGGRG